MKVRSHHSCDPNVHFALIENDSVLYEIWTISQLIFPSLYIGKRVISRTCGRCQEEYESISAQHGHTSPVKITDWDAFLENPTGTLTRMLI